MVIQLNNHNLIKKLFAIKIICQLNKRSKQTNKAARVLLTQL